MKKTTFKTILAAALLGIAGSAAAQGTDGISIDDVTVMPGQSQAVSISYSLNELVYYGFEITLQMPDGSPAHIVKLADDGQEQLSCNLCEALGATGAEFTLYSFDDGSGNYLFRSLSLKSNAIPSGEGELLTFNIEADAAAAIGESFEVEVTEARFAYLDEATDKMAWKVFNPFTFTVTVSDRVILDENSAKAPQASDGAVDVTVLRTIKANEWSTLCLPFNMTATMFSTVFDGLDAKVAEFTGFETLYSSDDDTSPDAINVQFTTFTPNVRKPLRAGTPYLIKLGTAVESFDVDGVTINPALSSVNKADADGLQGSFIGTLAKTVVPADALFISGNNFWYSTGKTNIKAFRAWLELEPVVGKDLSFTNVGFLVDGDPTAVENVDVAVGQPRGDVFTVQGQLVGRGIDPTTLPAGIYIVNGKKLFIK